MSLTLYNHSGQLNGWGDQIDLPLEREALSFKAGTLNASVSVNPNRRVILFVDKYDPQSGQWTEVARSGSSRGAAEIEMSVEVGEYGFTLMSLDRGSWYELSATVD